MKAKCNQKIEIASLLPCVAYVENQCSCIFVLYHDFVQFFFCLIACYGNHTKIRKFFLKCRENTTYVKEIAEIPKFMQILILIRLNYLLLPNWVVILLVFIDFHRFLYSAISLLFFSWYR